MSYVTLEYANAYIASHYVSTNPLRTSWDGLSDEDKQVLLTRSFDELETLPYTGRKLVPGQQNAFPRINAPRIYGSAISYEIPVAVQNAQCTNALALTDTELVDDVAFYDRLRSMGIKAYSLGNLSESIDAPAGPDARWGVRLSMETLRLLQPWLQGGYRIV